MARPTAQEMARKFRIRDAAREERLVDEAREAYKEAQRCEMFDDRDYYSPGAKYW